MTRGMPAAGADLEAEISTPAQGGARASARLVVVVALFVVLAGIWACLWVPPPRGF